jgi:transketolase
VCDHHTFVICSDGDLEEGISHEAASLAGHLGLGRLVYVYDDNHISIDGPTELALSDDACARFEAYGWHVDDIGDVANDLDTLEAALLRAKRIDDAPSLIVLRSHIGYPSPNYTDTEFAHGNALGEDEVAATKRIMGLPDDQTFHVPDDVLALYHEAGARGRPVREAWEQRFAAWSGDREALQACLDGRGLPGWESCLPSWEPGGKKVATRKAIGACVEAAVNAVPGLMGGGADLTGNTGTTIKGHGLQSADEPAGRQIHFGVREHGMGGVMNGMAMHGGTIPMGGTFLQFSDYMRGSVRLAAISEAHVLFVWTHDSVGLGEDGPTHQPIEHIASLRAMPDLRVIRPADANETASAFRLAIDTDGPTALILSRQDLPVLDGTSYDGVACGAYILSADDADPDLTLIGTGGETWLCVEAAAVLREEGLSVQVVSMPSWELFAAQDEDTQEAVLPADVPTLAVEAGTTFGWDRWADDCLGIDTFGASAPGTEALENFGFTSDNVVLRARQLLEDLS